MIKPCAKKKKKPLDNLRKEIVVTVSFKGFKIFLVEGKYLIWIFGGSWKRLSKLDLTEGVNLLIFWNMKGVIAPDNTSRIKLFFDPYFKGLFGYFPYILFQFDSIHFL